MEYPRFSEIASPVAAALTAISTSVTDSGLDKAMIEMIKIRASQINGCAFCVQYHLNIARKLSLSEIKLGLLAVWREADVFTAREKAALAWTESLTHVTPEGITDESYHDAANEFSETELTFLTAAVASINAWNRIAMAFRFAPPIPKDATQV